MTARAATVAKRGGFLPKVLQEAEDRLGIGIIRTDERDRLQEAATTLRSRDRELEDLGWQVLDVMGAQPQELTPQQRRVMVQKARYVWLNDAQAGASVALMNDFVFGRGVPAPRANDKAVQETIDEFWSDPDNRRVLTSYAGQIAFGTDLALQSNVFFQVFDDGADGKVKVTTLSHDEVENAVRDPENRLRVLYYVARHRRFEWDFDNDRMKMATSGNFVQPKPTYYKSWEFESAEEDERREGKLETAPASRTGDGRIYHVAINRYSEQVFGTPEFQRLIRWYSAYNDFMKARLDIAQASAAFIMKRKIKGSPAQLARLASQALSRRGEIAGGMEGPNTLQTPPTPGAILDENENVSHENFNLNSQAGNAQTDASMIRAPISAGTRFPQSYYGDATNSNLATATSLELPVLKAVEARQEIVEGLIRALIDRVIERAVDTGAISDQLTPEEIQDLAPQEQTEVQQLAAAKVPEEATILESRSYVVGSEPEGYTLRGVVSYEIDDEIRQAHEDKTLDEVSTKRDLAYDFSMPSPLRRMMSDLVSSVATIAQTFDPNNENLELTKALATIVFGEALEVSNPSDMVDQIWPEGYVSPSQLAMQAQAGGGAAEPANPFGPGAGDQPFPTGEETNPYGGPMQSSRPEMMRSAGAYNAMEASSDEIVEVLLDRDERAAARARGRADEVARLFDQEVARDALDRLNGLLLKT